MLNWSPYFEGFGVGIRSLGAKAVQTDRQIGLAFLCRGKKPICGQKNCLEKERFEEISAKISKFEMDGSKK